MRTFQWSFWLAGICLLLLQDVSLADGDDGKCASSIQLECPYLTDLCNHPTFVSDCLDCNGYLNTDSRSETCFDRKLLNGRDNPNPSYLWRDIAGIVVWFFAAGVATACGVGGGGIYVPLGMLLLNFAPKPSSGLSQASIFGASLGGLLLNLRNKHPFTTKLEEASEDGIRRASIMSIPTNDHGYQDEDGVHHHERPLIDYDMALFLAPMEMSGAVLGVLIQKILPNWLYLTLAAIILGFTSYKTYSEFVDTRRKEHAAENSLLEEQEAENTATGSTTQEQALFIAPQEASGPEGGLDTTIAKSYTTQATLESEDVTGGEPTTVEEAKEESVDTESNNGINDPEKIARRNFLLERDARQFPLEKLFALLILWIGLILLTFFKGGKGVDSIIGITCKSPWYGILIGIQFCWTLSFSAFFGHRLMKSTEEKVSVGYPFHPHDVLWDFSQTRFYAFFTFIAGIVAGLIGIGGGMVLGPLMLIMGVHPRVSSATTATMIVLTSSSVAILFVTAGLVPWEYAVTFFFVCMVGAYLGKTKIDGYVKRTGKASLLILLLAIIIGLATLGCIVIVFLRLAANDWCFAGFNQFCSISTDSSDEDICGDHRMLNDSPFGYPFEL